MIAGPVGDGGGHPLTDGQHRLIKLTDLGRVGCDATWSGPNPSNAWAMLESTYR